jgi:hypothetical protein
MTSMFLAQICGWSILLTGRLKPPHAQEIYGSAEAVPFVQRLARGNRNLDRSG